MLEIDNLNAFHGKSHTLHNVSLRVGKGEIVSLLGRNGAGRSTTVKAVMGLVEATGSVKWNGTQLIGLEPFEISRTGVGYVPETRDVFPRLTVKQNLELGRKPGTRGSRWSVADMVRMFPKLGERQHTEAGVLSGGEQQMLTLCRTLMGDPQLMLIDEPTEGLAPRLVEQVAGFIHELSRRSVSVILVEQKLTIALAVSHRCYVMGRGRVVFEGTPQQLREADSVRSEWLQV